MLRRIIFCHDLYQWFKIRILLFFKRFWIWIKQLVKHIIRCDHFNLWCIKQIALGIQSKWIKMIRKSAYQKFMWIFQQRLNLIVESLIKRYWHRGNLVCYILLRPYGNYAFINITTRGWRFWNLTWLWLRSDFDYRSNWLRPRSWWDACNWYFNGIWHIFSLLPLLLFCWNKARDLFRIQFYITI